MIRHGKTERKIDLLTQETEATLDGYYSAALATVLRKNRPALNKIKAIMDEEVSPPRYCVSEWQKALWRKRQLTKILKASDLEAQLIQAAQQAGDKCEKDIEAMRDAVYNTAYNDTYNRLRK